MHCFLGGQEQRAQAQAENLPHWECVCCDEYVAVANTPHG